MPRALVWTGPSCIGSGRPLCSQAAGLHSHALPRPARHFASAAEVCGEMCSGRALAEPLVRMGEALGMTAVPLTPGGSAAQEAALLAAAAAAADAQHQGQQQQQPVGGFGDGGEAYAVDGAAEADAHGGLQGIGDGGGAGSTADRAERPEVSNHL